MDWRRFLVANAAGGIVWACIFGLAAYTFGSALMQVAAPLATGLVIIAAFIVIGAMWFVRAHEVELEAEAERALPGALPPVHRLRDRSVRPHLVTPPKSKMANQ